MEEYTYSHITAILVAASGPTVAEAKFSCSP
jgi:hypothetical protein